MEDNNTINIYARDHDKRTEPSQFCRSARSGTIQYEWVGLNFQVCTPLFYDLLLCLLAYHLKLYSLPSVKPHADRSILKLIYGIG